ncbi:MAG: DUF5615 family PIN-like protein [Microthrixaceae bacterium]
MTVRFLADENFNRKIVVGLQRRIEDLDLVRVQDVSLRTAEDPEVLEWAAEHGRVLLTHDIQTVPDFAHRRVIAEQSQTVAVLGFQVLAGQWWTLPDTRTWSWGESNPRPPGGWHTRYDRSRLCHSQPWHRRVG